MNFKLIVFIFKFIYTNLKLGFLIFLTLKIITSFFPLINIHIFAKFINSITLFTKEQDNFNEILMIFFIQLAVLTITFIINHLIIINDQFIENNITYHCKNMLLEKTSQINYIKFEDPEFYNIFQRVSSDTSRVYGFINELVTIVSGFISLTSVLLYLLNINWLIVLILVVGVIPFLVIEMKFSAKHFKLFKELMPFNRKEGYLTNLLSHRTSLKEIFIYNTYQKLLNKWNSIFLYVAKKRLNITIEKSKQLAFTELFSVITYGVCGIIVLYSLKENTSILGGLVATFQSIQLFQGQITTISSNFSRLRESSLYINDFYHFISKPVEKRIKNNMLIGEVNSIRISDLTFKYPNKKEPSLYNFNLTLNRGEKIAIVGDNGSGKTTLIKCLTGLYESNNSIYINDVLLEDLELASYQKNISIIFQDFVKYEFSLNYNISLNESMNAFKKKRLEEVAIQSGISKYIETFENDFETILGRFIDEGEQLSGGQWQKVAIARAIYQEKDLIILDEPTSSIDPISEFEILTKLFEENKEKSIILVTHRLGAAKLADTILVLKDGKVIEEGTHYSLLKLKGEYYRMYNTQNNWSSKEAILV
ncbi:ABC transporter ATP-binding protein [Cytobacillus kochii]|uniref:ABC transporter ATP-binding protein n=1 Tax=Cytobacillus kochii TaxID=859143 RepID=UPI00203B83D8|nr:ABC transporter ATP-binding protein [Cytobacillus kochii]MCM3324819.1 ABC transporter ATP-binding protein/permease [Cytobacillus kochii]MCM3347212.1 ABC transporter ATP-binding protein/permease [Cytobacillus kochii]